MVHEIISVSKCVLISDKSENTTRWTENYGLCFWNKALKLSQMGPDVSSHCLTEMITYSERNVVGETVTKMQEEIFHKQWLH